MNKQTKEALAKYLLALQAMNANETEDTVDNFELVKAWVPTATEDHATEYFGGLECDGVYGRKVWDFIKAWEAENGKVFPGQKYGDNE